MDFNEAYYLATRAIPMKFLRPVHFRRLQKPILEPRILFLACPPVIILNAVK
jgi:hypothetical protein